MLAFGTIVLMFFRCEERDISWIDDVTVFIEELKPSEPIESCYVSMYQFYLYENGNKQIIFCSSNKSDIFVDYVRGLLNKVNRIVNGSVTTNFLDEVLESNKVLEVFFRQGNDFSSVKKVISAYFILEDNTNKNLQGTIIIHSYVTKEGEYSLREIA